MIYGVKDQGTGSLIGKDLHGVHVESYTTYIKTIKCWPNLVGKNEVVFWLSVLVLRGWGVQTFFLPSAPTFVYVMDLVIFFQIMEVDFLIGVFGAMVVVELSSKAVHRNQI